MPRPLDKLMTLTLRLREVEHTFNANDLFVLVYIAQNEGITMDELIVRIETVAASSVSRICARLGDYSPITKGHGYVTMLVYPGDARRRSMFLTPAGKRFVQSLEQAVS